MPLPSPKHGLSPVFREKKHVGWNKRVNGKPKWICSAATAPTPDAADAYYAENFAELWDNAPKVVGGNGITVEDLGNYFVERKQRAKIEPRSLQEINDAVQDFADAVGPDTVVADLVPKHFATARAGWEERFGPVRLAKFVGIIHGMFEWGRKPPLRLADPDYGDEFNRPKKREFKLAKEARKKEHGLNVFTPGEIAAIFQAATPNLLGMCLLGINCGQGNTDVAELTERSVDLQNGWLDYARGKTLAERRCRLWPETVQAIRDAVKRRVKLLAGRRKKGLPVIADTADLVFVTRLGHPYIAEITSESDGRSVHKDRVSAEFGKLLDAAKVPRRRRGFYTLRRTFRTWADETGDQRAAALIMGHELQDMGGVYVQSISDERLIRVSDHVRSKLVDALEFVARAQARGPNDGEPAAGSPAAVQSTASASR